MPVTEPIYKLLDKDLVKSLQEKHYSASESEVNKILTKNGGKIELRRQINDYFTFTVKDQENEIIILRAGKTEYSINCTCQNFQSKSTCAHIASVLNSIENQFEKAEENENLELIVISLAQSKSHWLDNQKYYYGFVSQKVLDDQLEMTFLCSSPESFARWFMMFGGSARIIESESLKNHVKQMIVNISQSL